MVARYVRKKQLRYGVVLCATARVGGMRSAVMLRTSKFSTDLVPGRFPGVLSIASPGLVCRTMRTLLTEYRQRPFQKLLERHCSDARYMLSFGG